MSYSTDGPCPIPRCRFQSCVLLYLGGCIKSTVSQYELAPGHCAPARQAIQLKPTSTIVDPYEKVLVLDYCITFGGKQFIDWHVTELGNWRHCSVRSRSNPQDHLLCIYAEQRSHGGGSKSKSIIYCHGRLHARTHGGCQTGSLIIRDFLVVAA